MQPPTDLPLLCDETHGQRVLHLSDLQGTDYPMQAASKTVLFTDKVNEDFEQILKGPILRSEVQIGRCRVMQHSCIRIAM